MKIDERDELYSCLETLRDACAISECDRCTIKDACNHYLDCSLMTFINGCLTDVNTKKMRGVDDEQ